MPSRRDWPRSAATRSEPGSHRRHRLNNEYPSSPVSSDRDGVIAKRANRRHQPQRARDHARCRLHAVLDGLSSREHQATALRLWNWIVEFPRGLEPQADGFLCACQSCLLRRSVCCAPRKLRHVCHEGLVFVAPVDDDLVLVHSASPSLYFSRTVRTCLTW